MNLNRSAVFWISRVRLLSGLLVLLALLVLTACSSAGDQQVPPGEGRSPDDPLPTWLISVSPADGADSSIGQDVRVDHIPLDTHQEVRLSIDGVDVTVYSLLPGDDSTLVYNDSGVGPVKLTPGKHTADTQLVESITPEAGFVTVDEYTWTFTIA